MNSSISVKEGFLAPGVRFVLLENSFVAVTILPDKGADIWSIQYKRVNLMNVLYRSPRDLKAPSLGLQNGTSEVRWMDTYYGGWQTMFPNAGADCSYKGASMGFHGEASLASWSYSFEEQRDWTAIVLSTRLTRTPFEIVKTIRLHPDQGILFVKEKIINLGDEIMDYIWGQHIAFGPPFLSEACKLHVPNDRLLSDPYQDSSSNRLAAGVQTGWPIAAAKDGSDLDFSQMPPFAGRTTDMAYLTGMKDGWYVLSNCELGLNVRVSWDLRVFPYLWLWQELLGSFGYPFYGRCYVMGVEPCSTPVSTGLNEAVEKGYTFQLEPQQSYETELCFSIFEGNWES